MRTSNDFLTPEQGKKLKELGDYLHEVRMQRGFSVAAIAQKTRIQERLVRAIETADVEELPEPIYIHALIRHIGDAVGVDGENLASAFPTTPNLRAIKPSWKPIRRPLMRPFHMYLVYTVVLIGMVSGLSLLSRSPNSQVAQSDADPSTESVTPQPQTTTPAAIDGNTPPSPAQTVQQQPPVDDKVTVTMQLQDESWLRVVADGDIEFEGILKKGEQRTWEANDEITLMAGNAGGVVVKINNAEAQPLGDPGAIQTVTYHSEEEEEKQPS